MSEPATPDLGQRLKTSWLVAAGTASGPIIFLMVLQPAVQAWPSRSVWLAWSPPTDFERLIFHIAVVLALVGAALAFCLGPKRLVTWAPCAVGSAAACMAALPNAQSRVQVGSEQVVVRRGWPHFDQTVLDRSDLTGIEVTCSPVVVERRRFRDMVTPAVGYTLHFEQGPSLHLVDGLRGRSVFAVSKWLEVVDRIDRSPLTRGVPRFDPDGERSGHCLPAIRESLRPDAARISARLLSQAEP